MPTPSNKLQGLDAVRTALKTGQDVMMIRPVLGIAWPENESVDSKDHLLSNKIALELAQDIPPAKEVIQDSGSLYVNGFSKEVVARYRLYGPVAMLSDVRQAHHRHMLAAEQRQKPSVEKKPEHDQLVKSAPVTHDLQRVPAPMADRDGPVKPLQGTISVNQLFSTPAPVATAVKDRAAPTDEVNLGHGGSGGRVGLGHPVDERDGHLADDEELRLPVEDEESDVVDDAIRARDEVLREEQKPKHPKPRPEPVQTIVHPDVLTGAGGMTAAEQRVAGIPPAGLPEKPKPKDHGDEYETPTPYNT